MIVYVKKYCVYRHSFKGKVFYVGMGRGNRPFDITNRSPLWRGLVDLLGEYEVEIVKWFPNRSSALRFEEIDIRRTKAMVNQQNRCGQYFMNSDFVFAELTKNYGQGS